MYFKIPSQAVQRCKNEQRRRSYGRETGVGRRYVEAPLDRARTNPPTYGTPRVERLYARRHVALAQRRRFASRAAFSEHDRRVRAERAGEEATRRCQEMDEFLEAYGL